MKSHSLKQKDVQRAFRNQITILTPIKESPMNDLSAYIDYITVFAEVRYNRSGQTSAGQTENTRQEAVFVIRNRHDLNESMAVKYEGKLWLIYSIMPLDVDKLYMQLDCYRLVNVLGGDDGYGI